MPAGRDGSLERKEQNKLLGETLGVQGVRTECLKIGKVIAEHYCDGGWQSGLMERLEPVRPPGRLLWLASEGRRLKLRRREVYKIGFRGRTGGVSCLGLFTVGKTEKQETEGY